MNRKYFFSRLSKTLFPLLREQGFSGLGTTLVRASEMNINVVNLQGSSGASHCYINLGSHFTFLLPEGSPSAAPPDFSEADCAFRTRLNSPDDQPHGWNYGDDKAEAEANVARIIERWPLEAEPFFQSHRYPDEIARQLDCIDLQNVHHAQAFKFAQIAAQLGRSDRAIELAQTALQRAPERASTFIAWVREFLARHA